MALHIVLYQPEIPQNTGNIGRTCAATGAHLHLIKPLGFSISDKQLKRAGLDYWHLVDVSVYNNLDDFYQKNNGPFFYYTTKAKNNYAQIKYPKNAYFVFGKETAGLPLEITNNNQNTCVKLPMANAIGSRSLNLSNTVAIATYEFFRQHNFENLL